MKMNRLLLSCMFISVLLPFTALAAAPSVLETPSAGLVSWWTGDGTATDFMGTSNGTLNGAATYAAGHAGQAFSFNGVASNYLTIPDSPTLRVSQFSISAWFNWNDLGTTTTQFLMGKGEEHFEIELDSTATTNNVRFIPAGYPASSLDAANVIQPGWNHVVVTYSGTDAYVYMNGVLAASRTGIAEGADLTADLSPFTIARRGSGILAYNGLIDDVALYNRVLDATEVSALYTAGTVRSAVIAGSSGTTATLYATVNDNGADTTVSFEYGATAAYGGAGSPAAATPSPVSGGSGATLVSAALSGLSCGTTDHYRIKAVNGDGTTYGADQVLGLGQCQTITFGASPALVAGGGGTVTATSDSGLPVTLSTDTPAVCSLDGSTLNAKIAGTCTIIATQAGNGVYAPASQTLDLTIGPGNQNISFGPAPVIAVGGTGTVSATSSSGLAVSFSSTTPGICTVSGSTVTAVSAGTCAITASQAGNATVPAARASQSFTITPVGGPTVNTLKPTGLIAMTAPSSVTFNGNSRFQFPVTATLNGVVNAGGDTCTVSFDYGSTTAYGSSAAVGSVGGASPPPVSAAVSLAWIDDAYYDPVKHYRVKAVCTASGTWYGNDITFAPYTVDRRVNESFGYGNASYPTANIWITPTCSDNQTMAYFDINNKNEFDVSLDYDAGGGYKGTVSINSQQTQPIIVPKGSIASFSYNYTLFEQILTNDRLCSEPQSPSSLVRGDAFGNPGGDGQSQIYALYNDNFAPITLEVMAGSDTFTVTIPARSSQLIATAKAEAQFSYNSEPFMILSPLGGFWANRYLVTAAPVSSTPSTSDFLLQNNDDAAHTVVLRSGGTEHRYTLPPYGSQTVTVEYGAWDLYLVVPGMTGPAMVGDHVKVGSLNPGLYSQSITFGAAPSMVVGGATGTVSATATSGLTASFTSLTTNVCTVSGTAVTAVSVGVCTIAADQAGNGSYAAAPQVTQSFTIGKGTQATVNITGLPATAVYNQSGIVAGVSGGSGSGAYSFSSGASTACSVDATSGSVTITSGSGSCAITATRGADDNYLASATSAPATITVSAASQSISFGQAPAIGVGGTGTVSATATSGLAVSFSSTTPSVCTVSGAIVSGVAAGTCTISANQAGNGNYTAALPSAQNVTIIPSNGPTVNTLKPTGLVANGAPYRASASSVLTLPTKGMLNGLVNPNGDSCDVSFEYGPTTAYGSSVSYGPVTGASSVAVSSLLTFTWVTDGSDQSLHYRTKAVCGGGTWYGNDITFVPFTSTVRWYTYQGDMEPANASFPTANIHIVPTCAYALANFDMNNWNDYSVTLDYTAGTDYHGSVPLVMLQDLEISVGKGSIASFSYNYTLFEQILTNDRPCNEPQSPSTLVRGYALGSPESGDGQIYALYNDNATPITLEVMAGSDIFTVTIPARSGQLIATARAEAQFSYNSEPFMILSPLYGGFWADRYLVTAAPVSSTPTTSDFLLQNNDDAAHTVVLRSGGTEHRYTLPPYGSQTVTVEYGAWDLYLVVPGMTGPAMVGDHVKVGSLNPGLYSQTIAFGSAPSMVLGGATGTVSATATSGLPVAFTSLTTNVCTVSGATVTAVSVGACTIAADQAGNASYAPAEQVTQSFTITGKPTVANVPATGLVSWWPASNSAIDSISGNNGALQGSATYAAGYSGQGFSFDGAAGSFVSVPDSASLHPAEFSAGAWFNWADHGTANIGFLLGKGVTHFEVHTGGSNSIRFIPAGYPASYVDAANVIQAGWNHIVVTYGSGEAKVYMNGALVASRTGITGADDLTVDTSPLSMGRRGDGTYPYKGQIDEVALFNRVLSAGEVSAVYNAGTASLSMTTRAVPGATSATLYGSVNDNLAETAVSFEYGLTSAYGSALTATPATIPAGSGATTVTAALSGLQSCGTTYHYRITAVNAAGTTYSSDQTFSTLKCQTISFGQAPSVVIGGTGTVSATGGASGNAVIFSSLTPTVCIVSNATVTGLSAGTCTIAADQAGNGSYAPADQATQSFTIAPRVPNAPVVAGVSPTDNTRPTWSWTSGGGGMGRFRRKLDGGSWVYSGTALSFRPASPLAAGSHTLEVQERNAAGAWSVSGSHDIVIDPGLTAPAMPTKLSGIYGGSVSLTWIDNATNELGYRVFRRLNTETAWTKIADLAQDSTGYNDSTATADQTWHYQVRAWNGAGTANSAMIKVVTGTLTAPDQLRTAATATSINLSWRDNTGIEDGYDVYRKDAEFGTWSRLTSTALVADTTLYSDGTTTVGILYSYQVCAMTTAGAQACSGVVGANGPAELLATWQTGTGINLTWIDNSLDEAGFGVYRKLTTETQFVKIAEAGPDTTVYVDSTASENTTYQYRVNSHNSAANAGSNIATITTGALTAPDRVKAATLGSQVSLTWRDRAATEEGYEVWRRSADAPDWASIATLAQGGTAYTDTTTTAGVLYRYQVCATTSAGGQACSGAVGVNGPTLSDPLYTPGTGVELIWTDNSSDETMFRIMRKENAAGTWSRIHDAAADAVSWTDDSITTGDWSYNICAANAAVSNCGAVKTVTVP